MKQRSKEKWIHDIFEISIILKGLFALIETIGGILVLLISNAFILATVGSLTEGELAEDPKDFLANFFLNSAHQLSSGAQHFIGFYLLSHGLIKLLLIIGLLKRKLWAYPVSLIVFSLFIIYQMFRYTTTHSIWLIFLTVLDLIVIGLTWHEYKILRYNKIINRNNE